jgi:ketosteroid isomerase-like protein
VANWSIEVEEYLDAGDWVVVFVVMRTKGRGSGIEATRQDAQLYRLRDGIVVETDYYNDRKEALKAVGLEG